MREVKGLTRANVTGRGREPRVGGLLGLNLEGQIRVTVHPLPETPLRVERALSRGDGARVRMFTQFQI